MAVEDEILVASHGSCWGPRVRLSFDGSKKRPYPALAYRTKSTSGTTETLEETAAEASLYNIGLRHESTKKIT